MSWSQGNLEINICCFLVLKSIAYVLMFLNKLDSVFFIFFNKTESKILSFLINKTLFCFSKVSKLIGMALDEVQPWTRLSTK